ncbi:hypothetical protein R1flu_015464 [Riccia fluitans]|uniref:Uncharacterized protein n=1 Tax=Riccia fluitans TaxID=41844 RepID=A0ABD1YJ93_9MARC
MVASLASARASPRAPFSGVPRIPRGCFPPVLVSHLSVCWLIVISSRILFGAQPGSKLAPDVVMLAWQFSRVEDACVLDVR